jgi:hypothetical protein
MYSGHVFNIGQMYDAKLFIRQIYTSPCKVPSDTHYAQ